MIRPIRTWTSLVFLFALQLFAAAAPADDAPAIHGFSAEGAAAQRQLEKRFDAELDADNLRVWMEKLTAHPHPVGSPHGEANTELMVELFRSWGYEARIETFKVLFPTPKIRLLELLEPTSYKAKLIEPPIPGDRTSLQQDETLPPYNAFSIDGDVTGELVYVNYGLPDDYEELALRGVDVRGKIVIARYGGSWRGVKPKVAAEHGAIGCILYSDPADDGYGVGDVYPKGGYRNSDGVQRGSVMDFTPYGGDPLTPLVGATEDAERLKLEDLEVLTKIPTLPISHADARPLLEALGGHVAPAGFRGGLPMTYHLGPGPAKVRLKVEFNWDQVTARDVIAFMPGAEFPDQWVMRGNHHDGWVAGAADPTSGMVALLEEARAIGELTKTGWRPKRTLVYAAWDAEEPALLGSIEWVETHAAELREKGVVYINTDGNHRGPLGVAGSHTLEKMLNQVMRDVMDPEKGISVRQRLKAAMLFGGGPEVQKETRERDDVRLRPLGFGSDYTGFLQFTGISSMHLGYGGDGEYGQYHSTYDSFDHYVKFMDPDFAYGVVLAQTAGRVTLRLSEAERLPFDFDGFVDSLGMWIQEIVDLPGEMRQETEEKNRRIADGVYQAALDSRKTWVVPEPEGDVPYLSFAPLENAFAGVEKAAAAYREAMAGVAAGKQTLTAEKRQQLNRLLMHAERALTFEPGLPERPWFRHQIYAPGVYTGYAPKTIPGIRESIEQRKWRMAEEQIVVVAGVLDAFAAQIQLATDVLVAE